MISSCDYCGTVFEHKPSRATRSLSHNLFCSRTCFCLNRRTPEIRFWRFVVFGAAHTDCWGWTGNKDKGGYTLVGVNIRGHRYSWELHYGLLTPNVLVRHKCHNPICTNPEHLFSGTVKDNSEDMVKAGRSLTGDRNPRSKLSTIEVGEIRRLYSGRYVRGGQYTLQKLSSLFHISISQIRNIVAGDSWK